MNETVLEVEGLAKTFLVGGGRPPVEAVRSVSFHIDRGEILGLVGETGCGKSTVARCVAGLVRPSGGSIRLQGRELAELGARDWRGVRRRLQIVFQNPYLSLDPRMTVLEIVREPLAIHGLGGRADAERRSAELLASVGIGPGELGKLPVQLSGGQRQRVAIARALVLDPEVLILDEPVSALDVSVQAQVINLLADLQQERQLSCLIILHDLAVASQISDRLAVMYLGKIVEQGSAVGVLTGPVHPYTQALLASVPRISEPLTALSSSRLVSGDAQARLEDLSGCRFRSRCPRGHDQEVCRIEDPLLLPVGGGQDVACHLVEHTPGASA